VVGAPTSGGVKGLVELGRPATGGAEDRAGGPATSGVDGLVELGQPAATGV